MRKLLKAIRDRRKRTQELKRELLHREHVGQFRVKRAAIWKRRYEGARRSKRLGPKHPYTKLCKRRYEKAVENVRHERSRIHKLQSLLHRSRKKLAFWERRRHAALAKSGHAGGKAVHAAGRMVGKHETGYNDAPWLREMERTLLRHGANLGWMIPGQPYCGFGADWSYCDGNGGAILPDGVVFTPNIPGYGGKTIGHYHFTRSSVASAEIGALLPTNFGSGGIHHVAMKRGKVVRGMVPTREFNTSPGNGGSQANGGGCYDRWRPVGIFGWGAFNVRKVS